MSFSVFEEMQIGLVESEHRQESLNTKNTTHGCVYRELTSLVGEGLMNFRFLAAVRFVID
jgi:hypothetical protein